MNNEMKPKGQPDSYPSIHPDRQTDTQTDSWTDRQTEFRISMFSAIGHGVQCYIKGKIMILHTGVVTWIGESFNSRLDILSTVK